MTWVKLDDTFSENEKVVALSDRTFRFHVHALCYASRNLTDGRIGPRALRGIGGTVRQVAMLIQAGLWEDQNGGWVIHDYLKYNPSREQVLAQRQQKADAGRKGGEAAATARATADAISPATPSGSSPVPNPSPTPSSDPPSSDQPSKRTPLQAKQTFLDAPPKQRVARLVDLGDALGFQRKQGMTAAIIRDYGYNVQRVVDVMFAATGRVEGDPWKYVKATLRDMEKRDGAGGRSTRGARRGAEAAKGQALGWGRHELAVGAADEETD